MGRASPPGLLPGTALGGSSCAGHVSAPLTLPFVSLSPGCQDKAQKIRFLRSIRRLCRAARHKGLLEGLDVFCHKEQLAEHIKVRGQLAALGKGAGLPGTGML